MAILICFWILPVYTTGAWLHPVYCVFFFKMTSDLRWFNEAGLENLSQQLTAALSAPGMFCNKRVKRAVIARTWVEGVMLLSFLCRGVLAGGEELTTDKKSWTILFDFPSHVQAGLKQAFALPPPPPNWHHDGWCTPLFYLNLQEVKRLQHQLQPSEWGWPFR